MPQRAIARSINNQHRSVLTVGIASLLFKIHEQEKLDESAYLLARYAVTGQLIWGCPWPVMPVHEPGTS